MRRIRLSLLNQRSLQICGGYKGLLKGWVVLRVFGFAQVDLGEAVVWLVKTDRRRFMARIPRVPEVDALSEGLTARCLKSFDPLEQVDGAAALLADLDALRDLPATPLKAGEHLSGIDAPMSAATSSTTRCTICRCWRGSLALWTRRRRVGT